MDASDNNTTAEESDIGTVKDLSTTELFELIELAVESRLASLDLLPSKSNTIQPTITQRPPALPAPTQPESPLSNSSEPTLRKANTDLDLAVVLDEQNNNTTTANSGRTLLRRGVTHDLGSSMNSAGELSSPQLSATRQRRSMTRHSSNASGVVMPEKLNLSMPMHMQLQNQMERERVESFGWEIEGCDPRSWIVAAGYLEKKRDGKLRDGWTTRFFVLKKDRLFYFLTPRKDTRGNDSSLLGEERGSIKMADILDVATGAGSDGWYIYMSLAKGMKKNSAFQQASSTLTLRVQTQALGEAWAAALQQIRSEALGMAAAPSLHALAPSVIKSYSDMSIRGLSPPPTPRRAYSSSYTSLNASSVSKLVSLVSEGLERKEPKPAETTRLSSMIILSIILLWQLLLYSSQNQSIPFITTTNFLLFLFIWHYQSLAKEYDTTVKYTQRNTTHYRRCLVEINEVIEEIRSREGERVDEDTDDNVTEESGVSAPAVVLPKEKEVGGHCEEKDVEQWMLNTFSKGDGTQFKVRVGPNYKKNKNKAFSADALYDIVGLDIIKGDSKIDFIMDHFQAPLARECDNTELIQSLGLPRIVMMHIQISMNDPLNLWGAKGNDAGVSIVQYFAIKPEVVQAYANNEATPAMQLWKRYCSDWETDEDVRRRLKGIGLVSNLSDFGTLAKFEGYNGKPFILNKTVVRKQSSDFLEISVDVRKFAFFAKKMTYSFMDYTKKLKISMGVVVQAEADEEMPEGIVLVSRLNHLDLKHAKHINEYLE